MTLKGGLIGAIVAAVVMYLADWGYYMFLMPMPEDIKAALGTLMFNETNMPNPGWFFVMELAIAGILAFACLQTTLSTMQVAQRGALMLAAVVGVLDVSWGMSLAVTMPPSLIFGELAYKMVLGAVAAVVMTTVANKMK